MDLTDCAAITGVSTGVALIAVAEGGENQIVVAPGANAAFEPGHLDDLGDDALICQLELPIETVAAAVARARGFVCINVAPAAPLPEAVLARADLIVANETEAAFYGDQLHHGDGLVAITLGAKGARLFRGGAVIAEATPPAIVAVDATGAGDACVAALTVALLEGQAPSAALAFACTAGALAATRAGAQPSLPRRAEVEAALQPLA